MGTLIQLLDRPIAYNPAFAKLRVGKVKAGPVAAVFLSQMVYWHNRMDGGWMYKTQADIASETALTRDEQETARKRLIQLGVLEEDRRGVPATMHYRINPERLEALLLETTQSVKKAAPQNKTRLRNIQNVEMPQSGLVQSRKLDCGDYANKNVETPQTSMGQPNEQACGDPTNFHTGDYTENTQETTQENKTSCQVAGQPDHEVEITDQAIEVLNHLNRVKGSRFQKSKSSLENIRARLRDGHNVDDMKLVIDLKHEHWRDNFEMYQHLCPETLFGPKKFEKYLQSAIGWERNGRPPRDEWGKKQPVTTSLARSSFHGVDYSLPENSGFRQ
ncbi:conserved phage C-terminal domain-containing protein [Escherichia coli]